VEGWFFHELFTDAKLRKHNIQKILNPRFCEAQANNHLTFRRGIGFTAQFPVKNNCVSFGSTLKGVFFPSSGSIRKFALTTLKCGGLRQVTGLGVNMLHQAEVGQLGLAPGAEHDVVRFHVAVDESFLVGVMKRRGYFARDTQGFILTQSPAVLAQSLLEISAFHEFQGKTKWTLYNSCTYIAQKSSPEKQLRVLNGFRELLMRN